MPYSFGLEFQEYILASIITDPDFIRSNLEVFNPDYFNDDLLKGIAECALSFFNAHKESPSKEALLHEIKKEIAPGRKINEYEEVLEKVFEKAGVNSQYYQSKAVEFAKFQALSTALKDSLVHLEQGDISEVGGLINDALKIGDHASNSYICDYFKEAKTRAIEYSNNDARKKDRLPTGFYLLDELMDGGLGVGELGVVVTLPKSGKTTTLVNMAFSALMQSKKVNYITLELSKKMIASKFDTRIFGKSLQKIRKKPKSFYETINALREKLTGNLNIIEYPTKSLTIQKMESILEKVGVGDLIIVDYGQLLKPSHSKDEKRHQISDIYENLRRIAGELKTRVWVAHQANRPGIGSKIIMPNHIAEDFNIIAIADIGISFNQTEEERRQGKGRYYVMGSRIGPSGNLIYCDVDWQTSSITVSSDEKDDEVLE